MALWRELRELGFKGSPRRVHLWLQERRSATARTTPRKWLEGRPAREPRAETALPSSTQLAWLLVCSPATLKPEEKAALARIQQDLEAARVMGLTRRCADLIRNASVTQPPERRPTGVALDDWLAKACCCGVRAVETFAAGLQQDGAAVRAALTLPWSNGQAEGQITKLKMMKRQMYGRANFDLLRRRILLAA
jgi:transposase